MADTTFVNGITTIVADWLNDVNDVTYGPDRAMRITGNEVINGEKTFNDDLRVGDGTSGSKIYVRGDATDSSLFLLQQDFKAGGVFILDETTGNVNLLRYALDGSTIEASLTLKNDYNVSVDSSATPTADEDLTTKKHVDDNFVDLATTQLISGLKTFQTRVATKGDGTDGQHLFTRDDDTRGGVLLLDEVTGNFSLIRFDATGAVIESSLTLKGDYNVSLDSSATPTAVEDLTPKNYVDAIANHVSTPATATSTGTTGNIAFSSTHFYVCIATNTWKRILISTW